MNIVLFRNLNSAFRNRGMKMEALKERIGSGPGPQATDKGQVGFEPEVLAFCYEH